MATAAPPADAGVGLDIFREVLQGLVGRRPLDETLGAEAVVR